MADKGVIAQLGLCNCGCGSKPNKATPKSMKLGALGGKAGSKCCMRRSGRTLAVSGGWVSAKQAAS